TVVFVAPWVISAARASVKSPIEARRNGTPGKLSSWVAEQVGSLSRARMGSKPAWARPQSRPPHPEKRLTKRMAATLLGHPGTPPSHRGDHGGDHRFEHLD